MELISQFCTFYLILILVFLQPTYSNHVKKKNYFIVVTWKKDSEISIQVFYWVVIPRSQNSALGKCLWKYFQLVLKEVDIYLPTCGNRVVIVIGDWFHILITLDAQICCQKWSSIFIKPMKSVLFMKSPLD